MTASEAWFVTIVLTLALVLGMGAVPLLYGLVRPVSIALMGG